MPLHTDSEIVLTRIATIFMDLQVTLAENVFIESLRMVLAVELERKTLIGDCVV